MDFQSLGRKPICQSPLCQSQTGFRKIGIDSERPTEQFECFDFESQASFHRATAQICFRKIRRNFKRAAI